MVTLTDVLTARFEQHLIEAKEILVVGTLGWWLGTQDWSPATLFADMAPGLRGGETLSSLPKLLCAIAAGWAGISAVRFRFVDL